MSIGQIHLFCGLRLRAPIRSTRFLHDGRTLNASLPCQLLHKVTRCEPASAKGISSERMRLNPRGRHYSKLELSKIHDDMLEYAKKHKVGAKAVDWARQPLRSYESTMFYISSDVYPNRFAEPANKAELEKLSSSFVTTSFRGIKRKKSIIAFDGELIGQPFECKVGKHSGNHYFVLDVTKPAIKFSDYGNEVRSKIKNESFENIGIAMPCLWCRQRMIGEDFLLCEHCAAPDETSVHLLEKFVSEVSQSYEDRSNSLEKPKETKKPHAFMDEVELAWILAAKYPGFTHYGRHKAKEKARVAAMKLAGRYLYGYSFPQIALLLDSNEPAVTRFCERARADFLEFSRTGVIPAEAKEILASGLLRQTWMRAGIENPDIALGHPTAGMLWPDSPSTGRQSAL